MNYVSNSHFNVMEGGIGEYNFREAFILMLKPDHPNHVTKFYQPNKVRYSLFPEAEQDGPRALLI